MPTLLDMAGCGQATPKNIDGISMSDTLQGKKQKDRPFLYREFPSYGGQQTVRVGDWKAVRQRMTRGNLKTELYNIANDIGEKKDVASDHPEVVARLEAVMKQQHVRSDVFPLKPIDKPIK
jgi:arylsulfatase